MANNRNGGVDRPTCSFCGRDENHVNFMIPSPTGLLICDHCIDICNEIIDEQLGGRPPHPCGRGARGTAADL